ncbi:hypothetical protein [Hydrogenophaga electricum]|uniref:Uncharacterized protein n=1 Tax=Hydrogenophaga electricum TaxID=1230953 RepID=A0ABQ6C4H4_9BURK|nr:hypothetical protein [Hydrogenophaga electricum]GLS13630.1 hypothetical protein GCM10007935_10600 [Hydrogenophaga electricum]
MTTQRHAVCTTARQHGKTTAIAITRAVRQVPTLRACALCMHSAGEQPGPELVCHCSRVGAVHGQRPACSTARAAGGACGPDARHMDMAAWQLGHRTRAAAAA